MNPIVRLWLLDPFERSAKTFVQQFVAILIAGGTAGPLLQYQPWLVAFWTALFAFALALGTSYIALLAGLSKLPPYLDLIRRVVLTFLQSFFGILLASQVTSAVDAPWQGALATAIPAAVLAALTGIAALFNPSTIQAGLVPFSWVVGKLPPGQTATGDYAPHFAEIDKILNPPLQT